MKNVATITWLLLAFAPPMLAQDGREAAQRVVATLQMAAQEYRLAFQGGSLVNTAELEEARLFAREARASARSLPRSISADVESRILEVERLLMTAAPAESVAERAREIERRLTVAFGESLDERPSREPSMSRGAAVFRARCAQCHGAFGRGDGELAAELNPHPANLTDTAALASTTPLDLFRKITHGVPRTAMPSFDTVLSRDDRWDVVAHVVSLTDSSARNSRLASTGIVFATVRGTLNGAVELARRGERDAASRKVLDAYLAFEAVEGSLRPTEPMLVKQIEAEFAGLREAAQLGLLQAEVDRRHAGLLNTLRRAENSFSSSRSGGGLFAESFLLILREGFEAILVIGAIMAVLLRAGADERKREVRWGVGAALVASLVTAALLEWLFRVSPAQREALEGGVMLLAAATLFYVSYWLVSKVEAAAWQRFVKGRIQQAVSSGSGLALAAVAFLAVYREGFETVLFYKALYSTGGAGGAAPVSMGLVLGLLALGALYLGIEKFGIRIPMRPFFAVTGLTLYYLAFVFAGQGVKELQEGGIVSTTPVPGAPRQDFFGVYPTVETLAVQGVILLAAVAAFAWMISRRERASAASRQTSPAEREEAAGVGSG